MERIFTHTYHVPGTLSANLAITFKVPCDCTLLHVSVVGSNTNNAQVKVGDSSDDARHLVFKDIGDGGAPAVFDRDDFVGGQYPRVATGDTLLITLDYDGASGTAAQNVTLVLTFAEG